MKIEISNSNSLFFQVNMNCFNLLDKISISGVAKIFLLKTIRDSICLPVQVW